MLRSMIAFAAVIGVLSLSGCCWPYHEGRGGGRYRNDWGDSSRGDRDGRSERGSDRGSGHGYR